MKDLDLLSYSFAFQVA